ncbi:hypothetical protein Tco_0736968 [Tanacetum coccineum]
MSGHPHMQYHLGLGARLDVAMPSSSWTWYALGKTADARLQIVAVNIPGCVLWKKQEIVSSPMNNGTVQLESQNASRSSGERGLKVRSGEVENSGLKRKMATSDERRGPRQRGCVKSGKVV